MSDSSVIKHFKRLCSIPHCSYEAKTMKDFLVETCTEYGYKVTVDKVGNILAKHNDAKVTLQAHYDMVCIGTVFPLKLQEIDGWLSATDSTLGGG